MSFSGNNKRSTETKMKERSDDGLKAEISEKIFEVMTKNNQILSKVISCNSDTKNKNISQRG
jgi:hypothetical protein